MNVASTSPTIDPAMALVAEIKKSAKTLGFEVVGVTNAVPPSHLSEWKQWLANGFAGNMGYLAKRADERADLNRVLPGVQSVIVVGLNYATGLGAGKASLPAKRTAQSISSPPVQAPPAIRVSRYAWGMRDYHAIFGRKLELLAGVIRQLGGGNTVTRWYVDTGPLLERDLAQRAGIGFVGKHTNLISRRLGNWLFLGEVLTTTALPVDKPERPSCGTCTRCLSACPTGALVAPYQLDARRCISYLTIELKEAIPVELRSLIGARLFGCDDCLAICPWNRFAHESPIRDFRQCELPPLTEVLGWDEQKFHDFFGDTPIHRLKLRGFQRNACVVLGNIGDPTALPALTRVVVNAEPLVREHAAWAIEQIQNRLAASTVNETPMITESTDSASPATPP